jgi:mersacidin/lichenicidin family type 2 lantibiotic
MKKPIDIVRAWKNPAYRDSLDREERDALPDHPAGGYELDLELLSEVSGGAKSEGWFCTISAECNGGKRCNPIDWPW